MTFKKRLALISCCMLILAPYAIVHGQTSLTVDTSSRRQIGGVSTLDRAQYFNHWGRGTPGTSTNLGDLETAVHSPSDLHSFNGRETNDLWDAMMQQWGVFSPEDPNNPGFFDEAAIVSKMQNNTNTWGYKYKVLQSSGWSSLRSAENPIFVTSGRKNVYPDLIDNGTDMVTNYAGYADLINIYLRELVYGTGPGQGYLPFDKDRFYVEIMNEPQWANDPTWSEVIALHRTVTELVKEEHPEAKIGGASCCDSYSLHPKNDWIRMKEMLDDMVSWETPSGNPTRFDFLTFHSYERYDVQTDGSIDKGKYYSPGHLSAIMDLYESYSDQLFGDPIPLGSTEYGSYNTPNSSGSYGSYARDLQQWDLVRDIREKLMVFMERPDRIVNVTPFVQPRYWVSGYPTHPDGDNVFWEQDATGDWHETIVASMYRMYNDLSGDYLVIDSDNPDVQAHGFRDGNTVYVMLNNLETASETVNLSALLGIGNSVTSASIDRIHRTGGVNIFDQGVDVSDSWQNLTLAPEEGAVLTLNLSGSQIYYIVKNEATYYGDAVSLPLDSNGDSADVNITVDKENAIDARVRVAFTREGYGSLGEAFDIIVNGNTVAVPAMSINYDDSDDDMVTRTVEVPLSALNDGNNTVAVDFVGNGGELISAVLIMDHSIGDYSGNGVFDGEDVSLFLKELGPAGPGNEFDLVEDGFVDFLDFYHWFEELRGISFHLGDFDLDNDIDANDLTILESNYGIGSHYGHGDIDFDGDVDGIDFLNLQRALSSFAASQPSTSTVATVPEPNSAVVLHFSSLGCMMFRSSIRSKSLK